MATNLRVEARTWKFGDHISTDLILPGPVMLLPFDEQPGYAFEANRPGWVKSVRSGDILVGGHNFGTGSGRPAARSLKVLGISCVIAESINGLFFRNCINYGLYPLECPGITALVTEGDVISVDYETFKVTNVTSGGQLDGRRFPDMLLDILRAEGIYPLMESQGLLEPPNPETA